MLVGRQVELRPAIIPQVEPGWPKTVDLAERGMIGQIATRGVLAPVQAGRRWVIERTHAWGNQDGKLCWCTERAGW